MRFGNGWRSETGNDRRSARNATSSSRGAARTSNVSSLASRKQAGPRVGNKGDLTVLVEGDPRLLNRYDVILLNPAKHPVPKQASARRFAEWLLSPEGQAAIDAYKVAGEQLFHPSATAPK